MSRDRIYRDKPPDQWALITVYEAPTKTKPIIVNCYAYSTKAKAEARRRQVIRDQRQWPAPGRIIALRVRPVLDEGVFES